MCKPLEHGSVAGQRKRKIEEKMQHPDTGKPLLAAPVPLPRLAVVVRAAKVARFGE